MSYKWMWCPGDDKTILNCSINSFSYSSLLYVLLMPGNIHGKSCQLPSRVIIHVINEGSKHRDLLMCHTLLKLSLFVFKVPPASRSETPYKQIWTVHLENRWSRKRRQTMNSLILQFPFHCGSEQRVRQVALLHTCQLLFANLCGVFCAERSFLSLQFVHEISCEQWGGHQITMT